MTRLWLISTLRYDRDQQSGNISSLCRGGRGSVSILATVIASARRKQLALRAPRATPDITACSIAAAIELIRASLPRTLGAAEAVARAIKWATERPMPCLRRPLSATVCRRRFLPHIGDAARGRCTIETASLRRRRKELRPCATMRANSGANARAN